MEFAPFGDVRAIMVTRWGMGKYEEAGSLNAPYVLKSYL
jgi:hypothetical protein